MFQGLARKQNHIRITVVISSNFPPKLKQLFFKYQPSDGDITKWYRHPKNRLALKSQREKTYDDCVSFSFHYYCSNIILTSKRYSKFMNSKMPKPAQISDPVSSKEKPLRTLLERLWFASFLPSFSGPSVLSKARPFNVVL